MLAASLEVVKSTPHFSDFYELQQKPRMDRLVTWFQLGMLWDASTLPRMRQLSAALPSP